MTQRKLTREELATVAEAYDAIRPVYSITGTPIELTHASYFLNNVLGYGTNDGQPLKKIERVPTKDDIGKPVKIKSADNNSWIDGVKFVGFTTKQWFVIENNKSKMISQWRYCIIDDDAK